VDPGVIDEENRSRNTRENAEYSVAWMREQGLESAVIVTSWWHSRRALACFRKFGPELEWSSVPSYPGLSMEGNGGKGESSGRGWASREDPNRFDLGGRRFGSFCLGVCTGNW
jgi:hypothetical protein